MKKSTQIILSIIIVSAISALIVTGISVKKSLDGYKAMIQNHDQLFRYLSTPDPKKGNLTGFDLETANSINKINQVLQAQGTSTKK